MSDYLKHAETGDLMLRYSHLMEKYVQAAKELLPVLDKFGKYRLEAQMIVEELLSRGVPVEDDDRLVAFVEQELTRAQELA